jgi:hypothetical protein
MSALKDLFDEDELEAITAMAADVDLAAEELVRKLVLEALEAHRSDELVEPEMVEPGEEPTMGLDELRSLL